MCRINASKVGDFVFCADEAFDIILGCAYALSFRACFILSAFNAFEILALAIVVRAFSFGTAESAARRGIDAAAAACDGGSAAVLAAFAFEADFAFFAGLAAFAAVGECAGEIRACLAGFAELLFGLANRLAFAFFAGHAFVAGDIAFAAMGTVDVEVKAGFAADRLAGWAIEFAMSIVAGLGLCA